MNHRLKTRWLAPALLPALVLAAGAAAAQPQLTESLQDRNKAVVRAYLDELANRGNLAAFDRFFAPSVTFNGSTDAPRQFARLQALRKAFPDHHLVVEEQIAEGDRVVTRVTFRGTHLGAFNGIAPTGRKVEYAGTAVDRLVDGKVVEMWHITNTAGLLQQLSGPAVAP